MESKMGFLYDYLNQRNGFGIIYVGTRAQAEDYHSWLIVMVLIQELIMRDYHQNQEKNRNRDDE